MYFSDTCCKKIATHLRLCLKISNMDKRRENTKKKIQQTYINMLMQREPINVRSLVKKANINKSTFYRYYTYLEELENELVHDVVEKLYIASSNNKDGHFVENFFDIYENKLDIESKTIFRNNAKLTTSMMAAYAMNEFKKTHNDINDILLFYVVSSGCFQLFLDNRYSKEERRKGIIEVANLYRKIINGGQ